MTRGNLKASFFRIYQFELMRFLARSTFPGLVYISWPGLHFLAWSTFAGLAYISWPGLHFLAWSTFPGPVYISWPGLHFLAWSTFPGPVYISWPGLHFFTCAAVSVSACNRRLCWKCWSWKNISYLPSLESDVGIHDSPTGTLSSDGLVGCMASSWRWSSSG